MLLASDPTGALGGLLVVVFAVLLYFLPSIVAGTRHTLNIGGVIVVNLLLGWTFIGWVIALVMAAGGMTQGQLGLRREPAAPQFSADGRWWWNGREWVPVGRRESPH